MGLGPLVELVAVEKSYGDMVAVYPLDLAIERGEFVAILGPSGCGKSTLLRMIGGFLAPGDGAIRIDGRDVTDLGPDKRPTNMVFQGYGLFTHMTVAQNVAYGLRLQRRPRGEVAERVAEALRLVALDSFGDRPVTALSGGQQQRVALARAIVMKPQVLLLDEPLAALDLKLRRSMQAELRRIHRAIGGTFIFVTHDQEEAMGLATRIVVMEAGRVVQDGTPEEVYRRPATGFVSRFIGEANVLAAMRQAGEVTLAAGLSFPHAGEDGPVSLVLRPEQIHLSARAGDRVLTATVIDRIFLGATTKVTVVLADGTPLTVITGELAPEVGAIVTVAWSGERVLDE